MQKQKLFSNTYAYILGIEIFLSVNPNLKIIVISEIAHLLATKHKRMIGSVQREAINCLMIIVISVHASQFL